MTKFWRRQQIFNWRGSGLAPGALSHRAFDKESGTEHQKLAVSHCSGTAPSRKAGLNLSRHWWQIFAITCFTFSGGVSVRPPVSLLLIHSQKNFAAFEIFFLSFSQHLWEQLVVVLLIMACYMWKTITLMPLKLFSSRLHKSRSCMLPAQITVCAFLSVTS